MDTEEIHEGLWQLVGALTEEGDCVEFRSIPDAQNRYDTFAIRATKDELRQAVLRMNTGQYTNWCWGPSPRNLEAQTGPTPPVELSRCLYVDIDSDPYTGEKGCTVDAAMGFLSDQGVLTPTAVVNSGHGVHLYWALEEPIRTEAAWKASQKELRERLRGDTSVSDWRRILRVPGYLNVKPERGEPVPCTLVFVDTDLRYRLEDLMASCKPVEASDAPPRTRTGLEAAGEPAGVLTVWEDYNARGDLVGDLVEVGWSVLPNPVNSKGGGRQQALRRPGKPVGTLSATFNGTVFYVFSDAAPGFEPLKGYSKFYAYAQAVHGGNMRLAMRAANMRGFGSASKHSTGVANSGSLTSTFETKTVAKRSGPELEVNMGTGELRLVDETATTLGRFLETAGPVAPEIIPRMLRRGEVMNLIGSPKTRKSFLAMQMILTYAAGKSMFDLFPSCTPGSALLYDNELTRGILRHRFIEVSKEMGVNPSEIPIYVESARGRAESLNVVIPRLKREYQGKGLGLIVLDAFYKLLPLGYDENDNAMMTELFNGLDSLATDLNCAVIVIHHTSKGLQVSKSVTDMGSGAGSMARAADTHAVLRKHQEENCLVLDAAVRSFEPFKPIGLRMGSYKAVFDESIDVKKLEGARQKDVEKSVESVEAGELYERFTQAVAKRGERFNAYKRNKKAAAAQIKRALGLTGRASEDLLERWIACGILPSDVWNPDTSE